MSIGQTYGTEFCIESTGQPYSGYYHKMPDGFYTSINHNDPSTQKLVKITENNAVDRRSYAPGGIVPLDDITPVRSFKFKSYFPIITEEDRLNGYITRYFMYHKYMHPVYYSEINEETYNTLAQSDTMPHILYKTISFEWVISDMGGVIDVAQVNFNTLKSMEEKSPGISKYFLNLKQFSKI